MFGQDIISEHESLKAVITKVNTSAANVSFVTQSNLERYKNPPEHKHPPLPLKTSLFIGTDVSGLRQEDLNQLPADGVCQRTSSISYYDTSPSCQSRQITAGNGMSHPEHLSHSIPLYRSIFLPPSSCLSLSLVIESALHALRSTQRCL